MTDIKNLIPLFFDRFGSPDVTPDIFYAPGSFCLIGDHTDYNGGLTFRVAGNFGTHLLIRKTQEPLFRFSSLNYPEEGTIVMEDWNQKPVVDWVGLPSKVLARFSQLFPFEGGLELMYSGNISVGSGLNASGSVASVTSFALNEIFAAGLESLQLAKLAVKAEHDTSGICSSIADPLSVLVSGINMGLFLNTHTLESKDIPLLLGGYKLVLTNSKHPHRKANSKYQERLAECQLALAFLSGQMELNRLAELGFPQFFKLQEKIPDETIRRRARHVISENQRVLNAVNSMMKGDLAKFGALMKASHESLRDNFEVTGPVLDLLFETAVNVEGVIGTRMTGHGYGGCTISLVDERSVDHFMEVVARKYKEKQGEAPEFTVFSGDSGTRRVNL